MMNEASPVIVMEVAGNTKVGEEVSATYAPMKTCSVDCAFLDNGCYAQSGYCKIRTQSMNEAAENYDTIDIAKEESRRIGLLTGTRPLGLHVSGDCTNSEYAAILADTCREYSDKNGMPVWAYTHNWRTIERRAWGIISVLASRETTFEVEEAVSKGYVASLVSTYYAGSLNGIIYVKCPAQFGNKTCVKCKICFNDSYLLKNRRAVFFGAHSHKRIAAAAIYSKQQLNLYEE
jgi:hypothetical protein